MPKQNALANLQPDYTTRKFGKPLQPCVFAEQLNSIDVQIVHAPSADELRQTIAVFLGNTWNDKIRTEFSEDEKTQIVRDLFAGELLPTAMETISVTWSVSGMDLIDTTHLIRHRLFSFAAQVHGDRDMRDDRVVVKPGIMANETFYARYKQIVEDARRLYVDMLDSGKVHGLDARTIMPRCFEHFYMVRCNIKDLIGYCQMRGDEQIQTTADNVIAMKLWLEVLKRYPFLHGLVDFEKQDAFYVKQCKAGKRNIFKPNAKNDHFNWVDEQFYHGGTGRDEFPGGEVYLAIKQQLLKEISNYA